MKRLLSGAVVLAALLLAAPAHADDLTVEDPSGNGSDPRGLDVTSATLHNRGDRIVVDVAFAEAGRGDLIVSIDPRRARGVRLVSEYRPVSHTRNYVVAGAFGDRRPGHRAVDCRGFRVRWSPEEPTVRLVLPARCLRDGEYDEVRFAVLTERGADDDYAPGEQGASGWVARG